MDNLNLNSNSNSKDFYTITEVSKITGINTYTLRYWEKNGLISPIKIHNSQRRYTPDHIKLIEKLKSFIYDEKLSIKGAKKKLKDSASANAKNIRANDQNNVLMNEIKKEIKQILKIFK